MANDPTRDFLRVPVTNGELAQSQVRNNAAVPNSTGAIRTTTNRPMQAVATTPLMGRK